ncbi:MULTISPECIES: hypothetical protein [unclassified Nocardia]|uniref:hypothetical protein n=1 Tax=unclassified Nocardia TaxID=2637762 RepID=UPI00278C82BF|nr:MULTISPECIES: hypothetical protein [unclassified Nocardia]
MPTALLGRWRIAEMDNWDLDAIELAGPGYIEFRRDGTGAFSFICVTGELDCRPERPSGRDGVGFSWEGFDEGDPVSGRGWAVPSVDGGVDGYLTFHLGDESGFRAVPFEDSATEGGG